VFDFDPSVPSFTERAKLVASDGIDKAGFGASLGYSDGQAIIAAPQREALTGGQQTPFTGAFYTYDLSTPAAGVAGDEPVPEPARALLALAALGTLGLLRSRLSPAG
jgi:hypothetical protein